MKKILYTLFFLFCFINTFAQNAFVRGDSIFLTNRTKSSVIVLQNATKDSTGSFAKNMGHGVVNFKKILISDVKGLGDSLSKKIYFSEFFKIIDSVLTLNLDTIGKGNFLTWTAGHGLKRDTFSYFPTILHSNLSIFQNGDTVKFNGPFVANPLQGVFQSNPGARESSDFAVFGSGVNTSTNPKLLTSIHGTVAYRAFMRGSTSSTPLSGTDAAGFIIGDQDITAVAGGSYAMFNQLAIKPLHIINTGGATIDSAYTLNITGAPTGAGVNGALKVKGGVTLLDLPAITGGTSLVIDAGGNVGTGSGGGGDFLPLVFPSDQIVSLNTHRISIRDSASTTDAIQIYPGTGNVGVHAAYGQTDPGYAMLIFNPAPSFGGYFLAGNFQIDGTGYASTITKAPHDSSGYVATTEYVDLAVAAHPSGTGTLTTISGVASNGFTWSIANPTTTPAITLTQQNATTSQSGQLTSTDWNTFNGKQATLGFTPENVANKSTTTTLGISNTLYPTQNAVKVYVDNAVSGVTFPVTSVFGRTGAVVATSGDYTTAQVTESGNLYYTNARGIGSLLTGYTSGAGTVSSTDNILQAIQKLNGNITAIPTYTASNGVVKTGSNFTSDTTFNRTTANSLTLAQLQTKFNLYGLLANPLSQFASTTSAQLLGVLSDETGSGVSVFSISPALTGTPTAPTATVGTNTTQIATTAFVLANAGGLSASNFVFSEVPSGTVNGSNVTFTIANTATSGTLRIFNNGLRLKATTDYSLSGTTITFVSAPLTGDLLLADYLK